ncbi:hypothetical protein DXC92_14040 [Clostridiales bacterium TF09-2AC]|nr:hypothetical protein DXC92_14040 [Clostridiales bacterium TF09-2AC]
MDVSRNHNGELDLKLVPEYQWDVSSIKDKPISLYARGMSTEDI